MRITTTGKSIKISLSSDELKFIVDKLGYGSITEMIGNGIEDMLEFIAQQVKLEQGIDIMDMVDDVAAISIMVINDIMLIEIPKEGIDESDVLDRPQERIREFMEHLKDAIVNELEKNSLGDIDDHIVSVKKVLRLYKMPSVDEALSAAGYVDNCDIIRWKGSIYIRTGEVSFALTENYESMICPVGLQPDEVLFHKEHSEKTK